MSFGMKVRRSEFQGSNGRRLHYSVNCIDIAIEGLVMEVLHSKVLRGLLCIGSAVSDEGIIQQKELIDFKGLFYELDRVFE